MICRALTIGALAAALLVTGPGRPAQAAEASGTITLELNDAPLSKIVQLLCSSTQIELVFDDADGKLADRKVPFIAIRDKPVHRALEIVCQSAKVFFYKDSDGVYHISATPFVKPEAQAALAAQQGSLPMPPAPPEEIVTDKVPLNWIDTDLCLHMLQASHTKRPLADAGRVRTLDELEVKPGVVDPTTNNWSMPSLYQPGVGLFNPNASKAGGRGATTGNQFGGGFGGGGFGGGGFGGGGLGGGQGGFGGGGLVPEGIQGILGYPLDNSLLVRGTPDDIQALKNIIRLLDIPPRQIQIKIEQIAVESTFAKEFGIDWEINYNDITVNSSVGSPSGGTINVGILGNNWRVNFAALVTSGNATVINSITVTTMNNVTAIFNSVSSTTIFIPQITAVQGAGTNTTYQPIALNATTSLFATPRLNGDNTITMFIPFNLQRFLGESISPDGQRIPNTQSTQLFALRRVASGQTIVVGGTIDRNETTTRAGVPILKDLPLIGSLFRSRAYRKTNNETLFFFTPTLLPEDVATGGVPQTR